MDFDIKRLGLGERIAAISALLLFVFFFFFDWYGVDFGIASAGASGWTAHEILRWLVLLTIILPLVHAFGRATDNVVEMQFSPGLLITVVGGITTLLVAFRMFIDQPGPDKVIDLKFGAWLGLISLIGITVGGWLAMNESPAMASSPASQPPA